MLKQVGLGALGIRSHLDPLSLYVLSRRLKDTPPTPPIPQTHLEAFRTKSGPSDLEVARSCLDPACSLPNPPRLPHSLPALKLLEPGVNLGTIKTIKGLGSENNQRQGEVAIKKNPA